MGKIVQTAGRNTLGEFAPEFAHFNDDVLFGENWNNQDIDVKTRSIITVVALMASGITDSSLRYHLQNAKNHGVTQKEIAAVITHVAFYAGWPKAWAIFNLAKEVWEIGEGDLPYKEEAMRAHAKKMVFPIGAPNDGFAQYFSGRSFLAPISTSQVGIFNVTFEPGCRNNWHIHHAKSGGGQILVCVAGRGYYQEEGKEAVEIKPGDCINIPAEVKHWHGAAPDEWFSHLAIEVPGENSSNEWLEPVSDEEYRKLNRKVNKMFDRSIVLNNGVKIPQLGLGTWLIDDNKAADVVKAAVKIGYRHIDTAQAYGNERGVGEGVRTCGIPREELFVVSKVAAEHKTYEEAMAGINETLEKMGLDYLDMMIIHSPQPWAKVNQSEDRYVEGNRAAWKALEDAYTAGKLRAIGVSNFQIEDIESLLETAKIKPMVNQILLHISNTPLELVEYCQKNNIAVEAYSPIAHGEILNQPEITTFAKKYGVTVPQLCIKYTLQLGAISLPKTSNPEHMKSNAQLDFEISAEDMELLKNFKKIQSYGDSEVFPVYGGKM